MTYLIFDTYDSAYIANATISLNMRLSGSITQQWAEITQRNDGKYVLPYPNEAFMTYVTAYTDTQEYQDSWFSTVSENETNIINLSEEVTPQNNE